LAVISGVAVRAASVLNQKFANNSTGPRERPFPAWGRVENRPAVFRRRRPCGACRAVKGAFVHGVHAGEVTAFRNRLARGPSGLGALLRTSLCQGISNSRR
jgi:hypothetical protein